MPLNQGFQHWGLLLEPGLRKIFFDTYKEKEPQYTKYMNVLDSKKFMETDLRIGGFGLWNQKGTLDATEYEDPTDALPVQYKHVTYSKGFQVEKELVDDQMYNQINLRAEKLARGARATVEMYAASVLNNAFDPNYGVANLDGTKEALIAMSHQRLDRKTGGTQNMLDNNPPLTEANLELAMKLAREQVDEKGIKIQMVPDTLVVPGALEFVAEKISKSAQLPGTNWNDVNPMANRFKVVVLDYLTSETAWFLIDSSMNPLNFFWREPLSFKATVDFDTDIAKYKGRMRFSYGWTDWRGIIGSKGDGSAS